MAFAVSKENVAPGEMFLACRALIRALACVRPLMPLDVFQFGEGSIAHAALF